MKFMRLIHFMKNQIMCLPHRNFSQQIVHHNRISICKKKMVTIKGWKESSISYKNFSSSSYCMKEENDEPESEKIEFLYQDSYILNCTNRLYRQPGTPHNVLVIQPRLKCGPNREKMEKSELKLAEAVALVNTLPQWKIVEKVNL